MAHLLYLAAGEQFGRRHTGLFADACRHKRVVPGNNLESNAEFREASNNVRDAGLEGRFQNKKA